MPEPLAAVGGGVTAICRLIEFGWSLKAVNDETATFLLLAERVQRDIEQAHRLRQAYSHCMPESQRESLDVALRDAEVALGGVAELIEDCRVDWQLGGGVRFKNKIAWVLEGHPAMFAKGALLNAAQTSLQLRLGVLLQLDFANAAKSRAQQENGDPEEEEEEGRLSLSLPPPYSPQMNAFLQHRRSNHNFGRMNDTAPNVSELPDTDRSTELPFEDDDDDCSRSLPTIDTTRLTRPLTRSASQGTVDKPALRPDDRTSLPAPVSDVDITITSSRVSESSFHRSLSALQPGDLPRLGPGEIRWDRIASEIFDHAKTRMQEQGEQSDENGSKTTTTQGNDFARARSVWLAYHQARAQAENDRC